MTDAVAPADLDDRVAEVRLDDDLLVACREHVCTAVVAARIAPARSFVR
jgi:hypothetical protein